MQDTAQLWKLMCSELDAQREESKSPEEKILAARKFEESARAVFERDPERLLRALEIAGDVHFSAGATHEARGCFRNALEVAQGRGAAAARARLAIKLATICESGADDEAARSYYTIAIEALDAGQERTELPILMNNLAGLQRAAGDFKSAERMYRRALSEAVQVHGPEHPEVALIANNLGVAYTDHGEFGKAEDLHLRALQIREAAFGASHPDVAQSMANLAVVYHGRGQHAKSERFYKAALEMLRQFVGPDDPQIERINANYERLPQVRARRLSRTVRL